MKMYSFMYLYFMLFSVLLVKIESYDNIKIVTLEDSLSKSHTIKGDYTPKNIDSRNGIVGMSAFENTFLIEGFWGDIIGDTIENYIDIWINKDNQSYLLKKTECYIDDPINVNFSTDGTKVVFQMLYNPPYGYDDAYRHIDIFDIQDLDHIKKQTIEIEKCVDYKIVGNSSLFCTEYITEFGDGTENYSFAIYKSKLYDENNRIPVAIGADMQVISSDGRYILATRNLYGKTKFVIIDALTSKLAYLWEDQTNYKSIYYDEKRSQFAFDYGAYIKYLVMPDSFPHDALKYQITDKFENESFWNKIKERY